MQRIGREYCLPRFCKSTFRPENFARLCRARIYASPHTPMDIVFKCSRCDQELSVEGEHAGAEIECPSCGAKLTVPDAGTRSEAINPMATSAAARAEQPHFKVPTYE